MSTKQHPPAFTEIAYILDRSGSMGAHAAAAIDGFNEFLREQRALPGRARLSLVLFDDRCELPVDNLPIEEVVALDERTYTVRGCTALLDAIGRTIDAVRKRHKALPAEQRPGKVVFAIFTDGLENSSTRCSWQDISRKIRKRQEKDGWEFLFLAANQDAIATAAQMSIHAANAANVSSTPAGMSGYSRSVNRKIRSMREAMEPGAMSAEAMEDYHKPMDEIQREEEKD